LAVNVFAVAMPWASVVAVFPPVNAPLAPFTAGFTVNVTITPLTRFPPASFTVACRFVANAVLTVALCGVPAVAVTVAGAPTVLVREKFADVAPVALAVTV
jgi:hypothetical protein